VSPPKAEDQFIRKLRKCEVLANAGLYTDEDDVALKLECMVVYVTAYPLDEDDAVDAFIEHVLERRKEQRRALKNKKADAATGPIVSKPVRVLESLLHQNPCRMHRLMKLDIDTKDPVLLRQLQTAMCEATVVVAAETRGGYHLVIERGKSCENLYKFAREINSKTKFADQWITIEKGNGPMLAVPGTKQGGFTMRLATDEWKEALKNAAVAVKAENDNPI